MVLYLSVIIIAVIIISILNCIFNIASFSSTFMVFVITVSATISIILIDGLVAFIIRRLPEKWFRYDKKIFQTPKSEKRFYEKIGIKKWKDHTLELGCFTKFSKKNLKDPRNNKYIERFMLENNYGFIVHVMVSIIGFSVMLCFPLKYALVIGLPVSIVNVILNMMSAFILRYNQPKLMTLFKKNERDAKKKLEAEQELNDKQIEDDSIIKEINDDNESSSIVVTKNT